MKMKITDDLVNVVVRCVLWRCLTATLPPALVAPVRTVRSDHCGPPRFYVRPLFFSEYSHLVTSSGGIRRYADDTLLYTAGDTRPPDMLLDCV